MSNLESTRTGWIFRAIGVLFMLLAVGLTAWDLATGSWAWPVNIVTFAAGCVNFWLGATQVRRAREHRQFMEQSRAEIARLRGELQ